jgi:hypothetical protein
MTKRRRRWRILLAIPIILFVLLVLAAWPGSSTFTVSPETTYVTGPLDKDGYVDYVTALNERLRGDITPEQNANVLIWQALGPKPEGPDGSRMQPEYFQWLGVPQPPDEGEYLVSFTTILTEKVIGDAPVRREEWYDREYRASSLPWSEKAEPELAEWLKRNEKPLAMMIEATKRPEYYNPLTPKMPSLLNALLPTVQRCRETAAILTCRAMLRVSLGRIDDAWQNLLACHRLGRILARGGTLIEGLVGIAIDAVANNASISFLYHTKPDPKRIEMYLRDLNSLPAMPGAAEKIDLAERLMGLETVMLIPQYGTDFLEQLPGAGFPPTKRTKFRDRLFSQSIDWDPALQIVNQWYDRLVAAARINDPEAFRQESDELKMELKSLKDRTGTTMVIAQFSGPKKRGEAIGNLIVGLMVPSLDKIIFASQRSRQFQHNLHLAFALAAYRADHGRYPAKLDEVAPKYLPAVHDDIFSGKPLIYRPSDDGYLLYSVGLNGLDDDGRSFDDEPRGDDLVVRMPVPEPKRKE